MDIQDLWFEHERLGENVYPIYGYFKLLFFLKSKYVVLDKPGGPHEM